MLEKPDIPESFIVECLQEEYGLQVTGLSFLPIGADVNTVVFRVEGVNHKAYFLKLRKGGFNEITVRIPHLLHSAGILAVIPPIPTRYQRLWASLGVYAGVLSPFVEGRDGYQEQLTNRQWVDFGWAMAKIHATQVPDGLSRVIPGETFSPHWREMVRQFQAMVEENSFDDPVAAKLAASMRIHKETITYAVNKAETLGNKLRTESLEFVLCHSDIHPGNLHISPDGAVYIVDWDNPIFAPRERDLLLIGGCNTWNDPRQEALFYEGYGTRKINLNALAYYRFERVIADFAAFGQQLLLSKEGGADREQSIIWFESIFLPGHELELAGQAVFFASRL